MAPEQRTADGDARVDVYALGAILAGLARAIPPRPLRFDRRSSHGGGSRRRAMQDVATLAADVRRFMDGDAVLAHREGPLERAARFARTYRTPIALVLTYLARPRPAAPACLAVTVGAKETAAGRVIELDKESPMSKPMLGLVLGGVLGIFDGLSALVSAPDDPDVKAGIVGIVIGSTIKGLITGVLIGWFAKRTQSLGARDRVRPRRRPGARVSRLPAAEAGRAAALLLADHAAGRDPRRHRRLRDVLGQKQSSHGMTITPTA